MSETAAKGAIAMVAAREMQQAEASYATLSKQEGVGWRRECDRCDGRRDRARGRKNKTSSRQQGEGRRGGEGGRSGKRQMQRGSNQRVRPAWKITPANRFPRQRGEEEAGEQDGAHSSSIHNKRATRAEVQWGAT